MEKNKRANKSEQKVTKNQVKSMISSMSVSDYRYFDNQTVSTVSNSGTFQDMCLIPLAVGTNNRTGPTINLNKIFLNLTCVLADTTNVFRIVLFKWLMNSASDAPSLAELFGTPSDPVTSPFNGSKPSRFKILVDERIRLDIAHVEELRSYKLKQNSKLEYEPGFNTGRNHIYFLVVSDSGAVPHPAYDIVWQLQYDA